MLLSRKIILFVSFVFLTLWQPAKSSERNGTETSVELDGEVDDALGNIKFAEFKERYRRLIPYMTYYVANNYVNSLQQQQHSYEREKTLPTSNDGRSERERMRKSNQGSILNTGNSGRLEKHREKFVPSVQYDPKEISGDTDYFTPVRYEDPKVNYDTVEYSSSIYNPHVYPQITSERATSYYQDSRYQPKNRRPTRPYNALYDIKYLPQKVKAPITTNYQQEYVLDYGMRTSNRNEGKTDYSYPADEYEPLRYVKIEPPRTRIEPTKPTRILAPSVPRQPLFPGPLLPPSPPLYSTRKPATNINDIIKSFQLTNQLPEMLNRDNIDSSIKTLVEILSILNNAKHTEEPEVERIPNFRPVYKTGPKVVTESRFQATPSPSVLLVPDEPVTPRYKPALASFETNVHSKIRPDPIDPNNHRNLIEYHTPLVQHIEEGTPDTYEPAATPEKLNTHLEDHPLNPEEEKYVLHTPTKTQTIGQVVPPTTLKYGATRGKPHVDYPAYSAIPQTAFNCKDQRYKGFFGDPSTGCQVWHYCDLNGGKSSFLCPNGTIFSQVALTCDWWFNVKCESTPQLYVLNERLYKYILPVMPKFPEDFSGPEVDRYLELKFKEMEEKLKEKKLNKQRKQQQDKEKDELQALENTEE